MLNIMGKKRPDNNGGHETQFRTVDPHALAKELNLDPNFQKTVEKLSQSFGKDDLDQLGKKDIKDLVQSVVDKVAFLTEEDGKGVKQIPIQISDEDYKILSSKIKKSQDANRGNPDKSREFNKQILRGFIITKAIENISRFRANKLLRFQSNKLSVAERTGDKDYTAQIARGMRHYFQKLQAAYVDLKGIMIFGKRINKDVQQGQKERSNQIQNSGNKPKSGGHGFSGP